MVFEKSFCPNQYNGIGCQSFNILIIYLTWARAFCITVLKAGLEAQVTIALRASVCPRPVAVESKIISISTRFDLARFWLTDLISDIVRYRIGNSCLLVRKPHFNLTRRVG